MNMPDYKEMYLKLFRASEEAVNLLIAAQRECEELYMNAPDPELDPDAAGKRLKIKRISELWQAGQSHSLFH